VPSCQTAYRKHGELVLCNRETTITVTADSIAGTLLEMPQPKHFCSYAHLNLWVRWAAKYEKELLKKRG
jgi:hypothetical protein